MKRSTLIPVLLGAITAALLSASFPKIDLGWLIFVALVPWLVVLYSNRSIALKTVVTVIAFLPFFCFSLTWVRMVTWLGYFPLMLYLTLYPVAAALILALPSRTRLVPSSFMRRWLPVLATPPLWVALEWLRGYLLSGFPWLLLGHALHDTRFAQAADIAGCAGLSFLAAGINAALAALIARPAGADRGDGEKNDAAGKASPSPVPAAVHLGLWILVAIGCWIYGTHRLADIRGGIEFRIGVVQGNVKKDVRHHSDRAARLFGIHMEMSERLAGCDLIVWPETSVPVIIKEHQAMRRELERLAKKKRSYLLIGAIGTEGKDLYNSAFFISPEGEFVSRYDKMHLVPFGEYIPLPWLLAPIVRSRVFYEKSFSSGAGHVVFDADGVRFATLICYEDVFPYLVRGAVRKGAKLLINMTSEGWFGKGGEMEQHLAIARMAAIESRTPVVRVANTGISAYIDRLGNVILSEKLPPDAAGVDVFVVRVPE